MDGLTAGSERFQSMGWDGMGLHLDTAQDRPIALDCSMASIIDELKHLMRAEVIDPEHDCSAADVSGAVCMLLGEIILKDDAECDKLADWEQEIRELRCKIIGEHVWEFDHCGYWGHQYCLGCRKSKYPELMKLRCSEAIEKIGRIKESEYAPSP